MYWVERRAGGAGGKRWVKAVEVPQQSSAQGVSPRGKERDPSKQIILLECSVVQLDGQQRSMVVAARRSDVLPVNEDDPGLDDIGQLKHIHEPGAAEAMRLRALDGSSYTFAGDVLIGLKAVRKPKKRVLRIPSRDDLGPACPETLADAARARLVSEKESQLILVTGEVGSGKGAACSAVLRQLCFGAQCARLRQSLDHAEVLLKSFGAVRLSSRGEGMSSRRFTKFTKVFLNESTGGAEACHIDVFLLETSQVSAPAKGGRSFNIFHQLVDGAPDDVKARLALTGLGSGDFAITGGTSSSRGKSGKGSGVGAADELPGVSDEFVDFLSKTSDATDYVSTCKALRAIGLSKEERDSLLQVLAGLLHLSNVHFDQEPCGDGSFRVQPASIVPKRMASKLGRSGGRRLMLPSEENSDYTSPVADRARASSHSGASISSGQLESPGLATRVFRRRTVAGESQRSGGADNSSESPARPIGGGKLSIRRLSAGLLGVFTGQRFDSQERLPVFEEQLEPPANESREHAERVAGQSPLSSGLLPLPFPLVLADCDSAGTLSQENSYKALSASSILTSASPPSDTDSPSGSHVKESSSGSSSGRSSRTVSSPVLPIISGGPEEIAEAALGRKSRSSSKQTMRTASSFVVMQSPTPAAPAPEHLTSACDLLGVRPQHLQELIWRSAKDAGEAEERRDALIRSLYSSVFEWLLARINKRLGNRSNHFQADPESPMCNSPDPADATSPQSCGSMFVGSMISPRMSPACALQPSPKGLGTPSQFCESPCSFSSAPLGTNSACSSSFVGVLEVKGLAKCEEGESCSTEVLVDNALEDLIAKEFSSSRTLNRNGLLGREEPNSFLHQPELRERVERWASSANKSVELLFGGLTGQGLLSTLDGLSAEGLNRSPRDTYDALMSGYAASPLFKLLSVEPLRFAVTHGKGKVEYSSENASRADHIGGWAIDYFSDNTSVLLLRQATADSVRNGTCQESSFLSRSRNHITSLYTQVLELDRATFVIRCIRPNAGDVTDADSDSYFDMTEITRQLHAIDVVGHAYMAKLGNFANQLSLGLFLRPFMSGVPRMDSNGRRYPETLVRNVLNVIGVPLDRVRVSKSHVFISSRVLAMVHHNRFDASLLQKNCTQLYSVRMRAAWSRALIAVRFMNGLLLLLVRVRTKTSQARRIQRLFREFSGSKRELRKLAAVKTIRKFWTNTSTCAQARAILRHLKQEHHVSTVRKAIQKLAEQPAISEVPGQSSPCRFTGKLLDPAPAHPSLSSDDLSQGDNVKQQDTQHMDDVGFYSDDDRDDDALAIVRLKDIYYVDSDYEYD